MTSVLTGAAFGAALTASGCYLPSVILGQLKWDNYHMLEAFLAATASSALIVAAANRLGYASLGPRSYADRGWIAGVPYDGNIVGGLALGAGMALAGACPGTVLAQAALNIRTGYYALGGGLVGGTVWSAVLRPSLQKKKKEKQKEKETPVAALPTSLPALLGLPPYAALAGFELVMAGIVAACVHFAGPGPDAVLPPVTGGLLIGLSQLFSVLVRKSTLGVSTVYEDVGDWLLWTVPSSCASKKTGVEQKKTPTPSTASTLFALGIFAGTRGIVAAFPQLARGASTQVAAVTPMTAVVGGFIMALGSRVAGGCTSGHGISGISLLSVSSLITMGAAFAGGSLVALFL